MITMFLSFLVERDEQGVLEDGGSLRRAAAGPPLPARRRRRRAVRRSVVDSSTQALLDATGQLVQRQAEVWAEAR